MGKHLTIYHRAANEEQKRELTSEQSQAFMKAWADWAQAHNDAFIDAGSPLSKTKLITSEGVTDTKNTMTGHAIIEATLHEETVKIFSTHPHLTLMTGNSFEVTERLPTPS